MGDDRASSVTDPYGRLHEVDNLYLGDASVFVSSGGFNPTNTIMALSLRMARSIAGGGPVAARTTVASLPNTAQPASVSGPAVTAVATVAGLAAAGRRRSRRAREPGDD